MVEVELKFEIRSPRRIAAALRRLGFKQKGKRFFEKTIMFDNSRGLMQKTNGRVRLRQAGNKAELSWKKPITRKGVKKELEHTVRVSSLITMQEILEAMDFKPTTSYEKFRTMFEKGGVHVSIDELPFGIFLEIEGPEVKIKKVAVALGLKLKDNLTDSHDTIFTKSRLAHGLKPLKHIKFPSSI